MISFIVSVFDRTDMLRASLASLSVQCGAREIIVCDNASSPSNACVARAWDATYLDTGSMKAMGCYESATIASTRAMGEWLCFPSDDSLYVQGFSCIMLATAERQRADLVYCDCVYRKGTTGNPVWKDYSVLNVEPRMGKIDKTCFILRRELFHGFPPHPKDWRDGALTEQLVKDGVRHAKAPGVLVVHQ